MLYSLICTKLLICNKRKRGSTISIFILLHQSDFFNEHYNTKHAQN